MNPYNQQSQEALFLAFDHGSNATTKDDCPYVSDDQDEAPAYTAWMKGYGVRKKTSKKKKSEAIGSTGTDDTTLETLSTELLMAELKKRKSKELEGLQKRRQQLLVTVATLDDEIGKLEILCE